MTKQENACAQKTITVQAKDLPLSCPAHNMSTWNAHPKVYLPIEKTGKETHFLKTNGISVWMENLI